VTNLPHHDNQAREFQELCDRRDLAAYNCANAIQFCLSIFEAQDFEKSREHLQNALDGYKQADDAVTAFHLEQIQRLKKENSRDHAA
jgi:hypothetical protein